MKLLLKIFFCQNKLLMAYNFSDKYEMRISRLWLSEKECTFAYTKIYNAHLAVFCDAFT